MPPPFRTSLLRLKALARPLAAKCRPVLLFLLSFYFDRRFLKGLHFESGFSGYIWAFRSIWVKNILRLAPPTPWPTALTCIVSNPKKIHFHPDDLHNFQAPGTYFQNFKADIFIGRGTYIAPNVGLITANHDFTDLHGHSIGRDIIIGERSWIGMNAIILPGVQLGPNTIVGAGSVVTQSFPSGNIVLAGVPARVIRTTNSTPSA